MRCKLISALALASTLAATGWLVGCACKGGSASLSPATVDTTQGVPAWPNDDPHLKLVADKPDAETGFAANAFPPPIPDTEWHLNAWTAYDCLDCHREGEADAPVVQHKGMPPRLLTANCRTCHVLIPGLEPGSRTSKSSPGPPAPNAIAFR